MKMLAAAHGRNQAERPGCCTADDRFHAPGMKRLRKRIQRRREAQAWRREAGAQ
jgi:hypothetical protein